MSGIMTVVMIVGIAAVICSHIGMKWFLPLILLGLILAMAWLFH